ncbi:hypothetical protein F0562_003773 [Nyssa sinensis]|uniref:Uncharacterized protein n=1 Tax=Nyssa sinensis TaxID=561372 RepID=A0A5J5BW70_9ASTE|nr:hypothetical protein F0562_003773 [Nyssa sinensis]
MLKAVRSLRSQPPTPFSTRPLPSLIGQKASGVRFRQAAVGSNQPGKVDEMEQSQNPNAKNGDVMSKSFGEGYATRSDEEGFGGIYGGDKSVNNIEQDKKIHANHPARSDELTLPGVPLDTEDLTEKVLDGLGDDYKELICRLICDIDLIGDRIKEWRM